MSLMWWPHTTRRSVASYRLRCAQVIGELRRRGVNAGLFPGNQTPRVLVLSKRYDADSMAQAQALRARHGTRLVLDLCDNHFFAASNEPVWAKRAQELRAAIGVVDLVIASTDALAGVVRDQAVDPVAINVIGDAAELPFTPSVLGRAWHPVAELRLARLTQAIKKTAVPAGRRLVWFGNHGSGYADGGMSDLAKLCETLEKAHAQAPLSLTVISNNWQKFDAMTNSWAPFCHYLEWHPATISRALRLHDVALIPISLNPFTQCKTNNRVATALLHGLAVAADRIPSYAAFSDCIILNDWTEGLNRLMGDISYREHLTRLGAKRLREQWSLPCIADAWLSVLTHLEKLPITSHRSGN